MAETQARADIWYLGHSGFAVRTAGHFLVFDYYQDEPAGARRGLDTGVIEPAELQEDDVLVFASHRHPDHFNPLIFSWRAVLPRVRYLVSSDIRAARGKADVLLKPDQKETLDGVTVRTLGSTDEGVAFLVKTDGLCVYHAGDLNWWHWEGEPEADNERMARRYKQEIDKLKGERIDIAFVPTDPRLEKQYLWGLSYFMETVGAACVFPMHLWEDYAACARLRRDPASAAWRARVQDVARRGQWYAYPPQS